MSCLSDTITFDCRSISGRVDAEEDKIVVRARRQWNQADSLASR